MQPAAAVTPQQRRRPSTVKQSKPAKPKRDKVVTKRTETARQKAQRSGLLAFHDELAALRDEPTLKRLTSQQRLVRDQAAQVASAQRAVITTAATAAAAGIDTATLSRDTGGAALASRRSVRINSPVHGAATGERAGTARRGDSRKASRSIEEIQLVFDRNKAAIYALYNRALREDPTLQGKMVLRITITPAGSVIACELVASELNAPVLERKIVARVRLFDFGAKEVETMVVTYPIDFLPS